jgi:hypothetical protein
MAIGDDDDDDDSEGEGERWRGRAKANSPCCRNVDKAAKEMRKRRERRKSTDPEGDLTAQRAPFIVLTVGRVRNTQKKKREKQATVSWSSTRPDAGHFIADAIDMR